MTKRRNELAVHIMAAKLITNNLKARDERDALAEMLIEDDVTQVPVRDADGTELGKASLVGGTTKATVVDEDALLKWVMREKPHLIRKIVDTVWRNRILGIAEKEGVAIDPDTGALIPGIEITEGNPYVKVTPNTAARERMAAIVESSGLLRLEAGES